MVGDTQTVIDVPETELEDRSMPERPCQTGWFGQTNGTEADAETWCRGVDLDEARQVLDAVYRY